LTKFCMRASWVARRRRQSLARQRGRFSCAGMNSKSKEPRAAKPGAQLAEPCCRCRPRREGRDRGPTSLAWTWHIRGRCPYWLRVWETPRAMEVKHRAALLVPKILKAAKRKSPGSCDARGLWPGHSLTRYARRDPELAG